MSNFIEPPRFGFRQSLTFSKLLPGGYGLIVYSLKENKSWRVTHNYFYLEPLAGEFRVAGHNFQWNDGVFSVQLTDIKQDGFRDLYFHSMAGTHMYKVSTSVLRNETLATRSYHEDDFQVEKYSLPLLYLLFGGIFTSLLLVQNKVASNRSWLCLKVQYQFTKLAELVILCLIIFIVRISGAINVIFN